MRTESGNSSQPVNWLRQFIMSMRTPCRALSLVVVCLIVIPWRRVHSINSLSNAAMATVNQHYGIDQFWWHSNTFSPSPCSPRQSAHPPKYRGHNAPINGITVPLVAQSVHTQPITQRHSYECTTLCPQLQWPELIVLVATFGRLRMVTAIIRLSRLANNEHIVLPPFIALIEHTFL